MPDSCPHDSALRPRRPGAAATNFCGCCRRGIRYTARYCSDCSLDDYTRLPDGWTRKRFRVTAMTGTVVELAEGDYINAQGHLVWVTGIEPVNSLRTRIYFKGETWAKGGDIVVSNGLEFGWHRPEVQG